MERCTPASALATESAHGRWRACSPIAAGHCPARRALAPYARLTAGSGCGLAPCIDHGGMDPAVLRRTAAGLAGQGAEALFFWNGMVEPLIHYGPAWTAARDLGHLDEIAAWQRAGEPSLEAPVIDLDILGDWDCRYVTPA